MLFRSPPTSTTKQVTKTKHPPQDSSNSPATVSPTPNPAVKNVIEAHTRRTRKRKMTVQIRKHVTPTCSPNVPSKYFSGEQTPRWVTHTVSRPLIVHSNTRVCRYQKWLGESSFSRHVLTTPLAQKDKIAHMDTTNPKRVFFLARVNNTS